MNGSPLPYGIDDLDPKIQRESGSSQRLRCVVRGCAEFLTPARQVCPQHGICVHTSETYSYGDPTRNILVDPDVVGRRIIGNPDKYESGRLGNEKSEDALTWNVFRSFQRAGRLGQLAAEVFGLPIATEPRLYLWGLSLSDETFALWDLLAKARRRFESNLPVKRPLTEPDIALHVPGVYLALIEAKFTSPNGVYVRGPRKDAASLTLDELLGFYADPSLRLIDTARAATRERIHYQLWRNLVFAEWMALQESPTTRAYHFNLVRDGFEVESATEFHGLLTEGYEDRFRRATWEGIYGLAAREGHRFHGLCQYLSCKSANLRKAFRL